MDLIPVYLFIFGACIGSFLNVCIYRLPEGKSIISPPSYCPKCKSKIKWYHNIPILSYIFLKGKCAYCNEKISIRYFVVEVLTGAFFVINFNYFGFSILFFKYTLFVCLLIIVIFTDLKYMIIPDEISIGGIIAGVIFSFFSNDINWWQSILGILIGGGVLYLVILIYYLFTKKEGMGGGDVKLLAMIGAFLGWKSIFFTIFVGSLIGTLVAVPLMFIKKKGKNSMIPFGPFLSIAGMIYLYFGKLIISTYLNFIL